MVLRAIGRVVELAQARGIVSSLRVALRADVTPSERKNRARDQILA